MGRAVWHPVGEGRSCLLKLILADWPGLWRWGEGRFAPVIPVIPRHLEED